ncbi:MAG: WGR domain-containing protein [Pirellulales bacterium]
MSASTAASSDASASNRPSSGSTRRFAFVRGTSAKFWEVSVTGATVHVRYGRIGSAGQRQAKELADAKAAAAHAERLIAQKLAKGYLEDPVEG